jgi:UDP-N-acetylmuramate--alanine ligase
MHIFFSGIGGTGIGPLALIAKQAGYDVSGSDQQQSSYTDYLSKHGISEIHIGQTVEQIQQVHEKHPIDWFVHSSAVNDDHPELNFARDNNIKISKRDELLNKIIEDKNLKLIAIAGTHGKTTTTAMVVWLFKQLGVPVSYSVGAKISFGDMGAYDENSEYFIYEADEFDRNFLAFKPFVSIITGITWDHHEIFPTQDDYYQAFRQFIDQSEWLEIWQADFEPLKITSNDHMAIMNPDDPNIDKLKLVGRYNRLDAWLAIKAVQQLTQKPIETIIEHINKFPGLQRRMEQIVPNLYSDYAHTPDKIRGAMSVAIETAKANNQNVIVIFEPLHNRRQHYMIDDYKDCFAGTKKLYWIPSYLAREDPEQRIIEPAEMIKHLLDPSIAEPAKRDDNLKKIIEQHIKDGDMVVCMTGGGGNSLDEWIRKEFVKS